MTYENFYGLKENPFGVTPDPRFFFSGKSHQDALAYLRYTLGEHKGFAVVTGEVGVGKTTVVKTFVEKLDGGVDTAVVLNPRLSFKQLLSTVVMEFGISVKGKSKADLLTDLGKFLVDARSRDRNVILIIDEAQNLPAASLEEIRMLSNLESGDRKLLQIAFVGQPELAEILTLRKLNEERNVPILANQCIVIEDSLWGLLAAKTAGMHLIAVTNSYDAEQLNLAERIVDKLSDLSIDDLKQLCT